MANVPNSGLNPTKVDQVTTSHQEQKLKPSLPSTDPVARVTAVQAGALGKPAPGPVNIVTLDSHQSARLKKPHAKSSFSMKRFTSILSAPWRGLRFAAKSVANKLGTLAHRSVQFLSPANVSATDQNYRDINNESLKAFQKLPSEQKLNLIEKLFKYLDENESYEHGIFRESPSQISAAKLFKEIMSQVDPQASMGKIEFKTLDSHEVAFILKELYRDLALFKGQEQALISLSDQLTSESEQNLEKVQGFVKNLSPEKQTLLKALVDGLEPVMVEFIKETGMDSKNLAIVFGPTLLPGDDLKDQSQMLQASLASNNVFAFILNNKEKIF